MVWYEIVSYRIASYRLMKHKGLYKYQKTLFLSLK